MRSNYLLMPAAVMTALSITVSTSAQTQEFQKPDPEKWYRLDTRYNGTDIRVGRCIQYYPESSEHPDMLWSAIPLPASDPQSDFQYWRFVESPDNPGKYAMICKADPNGYVNPVPTAYNNSGRWTYITDSDQEKPDKYGFIFVTSQTLSGVDPNTGESYCAIATDESNNWYMNCGGVKQDYAINLWYETYSEDANEWLFSFVERVKDDPGTSVSDISIDNPEETPVVYYDLFGRRVDESTSGIYIANGKKVVVRR